ncbi:MAG: hypothetical protein HYU51_20065, partial [Candidatus Rokubacteria bacterium]|nr:hypothetical protein [Candidatus Rokubacteria bacterium]
DFNGDGTKDVLDPGALLPVPVALPIDFAGSLELLLAGSVTGTGAGTGDAAGLSNVLLAFGPVTIGGTAAFALERRTLDVDSDGNGTADLLGATVQTVALSVSDVAVVVEGVAQLRVSGKLALASVTAAGQTVASYSALKMGDVTVVTEAVSGSFALTGALTISRLELNNGATPSSPRLNWARAFDFNGDGTKDVLDPGALLPVPVALPIDFAGSLELLATGRPAE